MRALKPVNPNDKSRNLTGEIAFHGCDSRAQEAISFYFNHTIACSEKWSAINSSPKIRAIVTTRSAIKEEIARGDIQNRGRIIYMDKGWVIYIKKSVTPGSMRSARRCAP